MKSKNIISQFFGRIALAIGAAYAVPASGQVVNPSDKPATETAENVTVMDPFKVISSGSYVATNAIGATRIATPVQDLPISVNIVTDSFMKDRDVIKIEDAIMYTSGVGNVNRNDAGTRNENFAIRGFNSNLVLRNGIPYNVFSDSANIVQIEVVKGANSVLYGVNSPGGLVNFVTKQPTVNPVNEVKGTVGSWGFKRAEVDSGGALGTEKIRYRFNMAHEAVDGPLKNQFERKQFYNPVVAFDVTPTTTVTVDYEWRELMGHFFRDAYPQTRTVAAPTIRTGYALLGRDFSPLYPDDRNTYITENIEGRLQQRFGDHVTLRVVAADTSSDQDSYNTIGAVMVPGSPNLNVRRNLLELNQFENRTMFADLAAEFSAGPTSHRLVAGAQWTKNNVSGAGIVGAPVTVDLFLPNPYIRLETYSQMVNSITAADYYFTETITKSAFVIDQITLLDNKAHLLFGVRYDNLGQANGGTNTTPQVGATYAILPGVNLFASYSESYVPNPPQVLDGNNPSVITTFPPESGKGYEAGVKFDLRDSTISGTISFFSITRSNVLQIQANAIDPLKADAILSGEQKSEGVEIDIAGKITPHYSIVASFSNIDARVTTDVVNPSNVGLRLEGVAKNQAAIWNTYRFGTEKFGGLTIGGGVLYRQGPINHGVLRTTELSRQGTYTTMEAAVSYEFKYAGREWRAALNVHNLSDADYFDRRAQRALPRNVLFSVGVKY